MDFPQVSVFDRKKFFDNRWFFSEIFSPHFPIKTTFIQDNLSLSAKWVFRGFHFQKNFPQARLVTVLRGEILDFVLDIRENSPTFWEIFIHKISSENPKNIFIPRGFAHAFLSLADETEVFYKVDNIYSPSDEAGFALPENFLEENFGEILSENKISEIILSEKDKNLPKIPFPVKLWKF